MNKNVKNFSSLLILLGIISFLSIVVINVPLIEKITNKDLHSFYKENISKIQIYIFFLSIAFIGIGILGLKTSLFHRVGLSNLWTNILLGVALSLWVSFHIEFILKIKPRLTTADLYDCSVPYEGSLFARTRFPLGTIKVPYLNSNGNKINYRLNQGYHTDPFPIVKEKDEIRILVLGGSFVYGDNQDNASWEQIDIEYDRNWIKKTESKLKQTGYKNVRLINAAMPQHATFDSFGKLYSELHFFSPDYVVMCHGWNDMKYFHNVSPDKSLYRIMDARPTPKREDIVDPLEISQIYLRLKRLTQFKDVTLEGKVTNKALDKSNNTISSYALQQFELNLKLFIYLCKEIGAIPVLLSQPRLIKQDNTPAERAMILYQNINLPHNLLFQSYEKIDSLLEKTAKERGALFYDFAKNLIGRKELFVDHVHINSKGNEVMSTDLANILDEMLTQEKANRNEDKSIN